MADKTNTKTKQSESGETATSIPTISEGATGMGDIKINHSVVATIVRLAALEVDGVMGVGSGIVGGIAEIFSKKESDRGVRVDEDEVGAYIIEVRAVMSFGVELAKCAEQVQQNVTEHIKRMTRKEVAQVNVFIDGIRIEGEEGGALDASEASLA